MKQGIEKIMQERWGFAHHQKTMLVDQDWHGQRYLTAYMGTHFKPSIPHCMHGYALQTQHSSLHTWARNSTPAFLTAYKGTHFKPSIPHCIHGYALQTQHSSLHTWVCTSTPAVLTACMGTHFNPSNPTSSVIASCPATFLCRCPSCHLSMPVSAEGLTLYLGPADQHALVLSVSVSVSVSVCDPAGGYTYDSIHHLPDDFWRQICIK